MQLQTNTRELSVVLSEPYGMCYSLENQQAKNNSVYSVISINDQLLDHVA